MKLTRNTEWGLIAALIAYIAFTPGFQAVKSILATPLGKAGALAGIVYTWKYISAPIALLLTISFLRCAKWNVWEMFSGAEQSCTCETEGAIWDSQSKTCKDANGNPAGPVKTCTCANGYAWDGGEKGKKECIPVTDTQPPVPPATNPAAGALAGGSTLAMGPTSGGIQAPSTPPMTTPGAAQEAAAAALPPPPTGGAQPSVSGGMSSVPASA